MPSFFYCFFFFAMVPFSARMMLLLFSYIESIRCKWVAVAFFVDSYTFVTTTVADDIDSTLLILMRIKLKTEQS